MLTLSTDALHPKSKTATTVRQWKMELPPPLAIPVYDGVGDLKFIMTNGETGESTITGTKYAPTPKKYSA